MFVRDGYEAKEKEKGKGKGGKERRTSRTVCTEFRVAVRWESGVEIVDGHYFPLGVGRMIDTIAVVVVVVGKADYPKFCCSNENGWCFRLVRNRRGYGARDTLKLSPEDKQ